MMRRTAVVLVGMLYFALVPFSAEDRPNFSGRWRSMDRVALATVLTIVQDATSLEAKLGEGTESERARYSFSEVTHQDVAHADVMVTSTAVWKEDALTITSTLKSLSRRAVLSVRDEIWSLDPDGHLVIETTTRRSNGATVSSRHVYAKQ